MIYHYFYEKVADLNEKLQIDRELKWNPLNGDQGHVPTELTRWPTQFFTTLTQFKNYVNSVFYESNSDPTQKKTRIEFTNSKILNQI